MGKGRVPSRGGQLCRFAGPVTIGLFGLIVLLSTSPAEAGTAQYGYDQLGRIQCVKHADGKLTTYSYDAAGNRTTVTTATSSSSCTSAAGGTAPPNGSVTLTALNPSYTVTSLSTTVKNWSVLGSASDSADLTITSAVVSAPQGGNCSYVNIINNGADISYKAPAINTGSRTCLVSYILLHPLGETVSGQVTFTVVPAGSSSLETGRSVLVLLTETPPPVTPPNSQTATPPPPPDNPPDILPGSAQG